MIVFGVKDKNRNTQMAVMAHSFHLKGIMNNVFSLYLTEVDTVIAYSIYQILQIGVSKTLLFYFIQASPSHSSV